MSQQVPLPLFSMGADGFVGSHFIFNEDYGDVTRKDTGESVGSINDKDEDGFFLVESSSKEAAEYIFGLCEEAYDGVF